MVCEFKKACKENCVAVPMSTVALFFIQSFRDGAFTRNDPEVRGYASQSTLRAMDLGADSKRRFLCCWGGHEGVETDAYRSADEEAVRRQCESITYLCEYGRG